MTSFTGEFGLQFTLHIASNYTAPEIVDHARLGHELGFSQIWVNDNLRYRQQYVVLTAIATQVPISLGTAVTVPYFRNPVDFADTLATLSEFADIDISDLAPRVTAPTLIACGRREPDNAFEQSRRLAALIPE